jgi:hypothetical protein
MVSEPTSAFSNNLAAEIENGRSIYLPFICIFMVAGGGSNSRPWVMNPEMLRI